MILQDQFYGVEIEFTGITRRQAAAVVADYFFTQYDHFGGSYDTYQVTDPAGRIWKLMSDASINCQRRVNGSTHSAGREYSVELVTPICEYADIETIQSLVRGLREKGGFSNNSCGLHTHVDGLKHTPISIRNYTNIIASKNDLLYKSLGIAHERIYYCKALDARLLKEINSKKPQTLSQIEEIWYNGDRHNRRSHYHKSRYHFLNLHSFFNGNGTIELRGFNSTLEHAGRVKAYIQLSLAMSHQALTQKRASPVVTVSSNEKYTFRTYLLRLGLIGDEFKTARQLLLEKLEGNIAWKNPEDALRQREARKSKKISKQNEAHSDEMTVESTEAAPVNTETINEPEESHDLGIQMH